MKVYLRPVAEKQLKKLPPPEKKKVARKLSLLANDQTIGKLLQGEYVGSHSLRTWQYRIIYIVEENTIVVYSIAHRHVYR